jgi:hypothetical protein
VSDIWRTPANAQGLIGDEGGTGTGGGGGGLAAVVNWELKLEAREFPARSLADVDSAIA